MRWRLWPQLPRGPREAAKPGGLRDFGDSGGLSGRQSVLPGAAQRFIVAPASPGKALRLQRYRDMPDIRGLGVADPLPAG